MTWNVVDNLYKDVDAGKFTFLEALKDKPEIYRKHVEQWKILANINKIISKKNSSKEELEDGAKHCELFCEKYPVNFPFHNITRKMHVLSCVMPKFVRQGIFYKFLKIEQKAENLHCVFNNLERRFLYQKNKAKKYFLMLKEYENMLKKIILCLKRKKENNYF